MSAVTVGPPVAAASPPWATAGSPAGVALPEGPAGTPPLPGSGSAPTSTDSRRKANGLVVTALVAGGMIVGALLNRFVVSGIAMNVIDNYRGGVGGDLALGVLYWLRLAIPLALGGGAAVAYLRPPHRATARAALCFGASFVPILIVFLTDSYGLLSALIRAVVMAAAATSAWLLLRGRPPVRHWFSLVAVGLSVLISSVLRDGYSLYFYDGVLSLALSQLSIVLPVVAGAWLGAIPGRQAAPATATTGAGTGPAGQFQVLYTAGGDKVLVPAAPAASPPTNGIAIASLVLALTGGLIVAGLPAIICGHIARRQIRERGESGDGLAIAGLVLGYLTLTIVLVIAVVIAVAAAS